MKTILQLSIVKFEGLISFLKPNIYGHMDRVGG